MKKKWMAFLLALVLFLASVLGDYSFLNFSTDVSAAEYTVKLSGANSFGSKSGSGGIVSLTKLSSPFGIAILNRPSSKSLWSIKVDGHRVFCSNGEKHLCTGDKVSWSSAKATTFSNKSIAKAITYYNYVKKANCSTKEQGMIQAYIWACGKGVNKKTAMTQAAAHFGGGSSDVQKMYDAIEGTNPVGYIVTCRVTSCKNGKSKSAHQVLFGWYAEEKWKDGEVKLTGSVSYTPYFDINIEKRNMSGNLIKTDSATFNVTIGSSTTKLSTSSSSGIAEKRITLDSLSKTVNTKTYRYAKNWQTMSEEARKDAKNKGITYKSKAEAKAAAKKELKELKTSALASLKGKNYTITVREITAPTGYKLSSVSSWTKTGKAGTTPYTFTAMDAPLKGYITIKKVDENNNPVKGTAVYGLYPAENIYSYDDGTKQLIYSADPNMTGEPIQKISVENGSGKAENLYLGKYNVKELVAPIGYEIDTNIYNRTISATNTEPVDIESKDPTKTNGESYFTIEKKKENVDGDNDLPEEGAEFYLIKSTAISSSMLNTLKSYGADARQNYVKQNISDSDILGFCSTGSNGNAETVLKNVNDDNTVPDFVLLQTKGEKGYKLLDTVLSSNLTVAQEIGDNGTIYHYSYSAVDPAEQPYFYLKKRMQSTTGFVAEEKAEFDVIDENGNVVHHLKTKSSGNTDPVRVPIGTYMIHQTAGASQHEFMEDQTITFTEADINTYTFSNPKCFTYDDMDSPPDLLLKKKSSETGEAVDGAVYLVKDTSGNEIGTLITGADGTAGEATVALPKYGQYIIKETYSPKGFRLDTTEHTVDVTTKSSNLQYDEDSGRYIYKYVVSDPPIYGEISLSKQGNGVSSYSSAEQGFVFKNIDMIAGAVYTLYARKDIKNSIGTTMWTAGTRITSLTTSSTASVLFKNPKASLYSSMDETDFWLGSYYIKEESVPSGYVLDEEEHDVILTDQELVDSSVDATTTPEVDGPIGNNGIEETSGAYVLEIGETINTRIKNATSVQFVQTTAPTGLTATDVSHDKDGTVVMWKDGTTYYISTQDNDQLIWLNAQSSHMFDGCYQLKEVNFNGVKTTYMKDCSYMFADCCILEELDLSSFDTRRVQDTSCMFKGCRSLRTIYVFDTNLIADEDEDPEPLYISAVPNTTFELVDTDAGETAEPFKTEDFTFILHYEDGTEEEIEPADSEVIFNKTSPNAYGSYGTKELQITFTSGTHAGKKYANDINKTSGGVHTNIYIINPNKTVEDLFVQKAHVDVKMTDLLQSVTVTVTKEDATTHETLGGAVIGLFAAKDIYSADGKKIISANEEIARFETTDEENFAGIEFNNLPVNTGTGNMYYVQEIVPPVGYKLDSTKHPVSGKVSSNIVEIVQESEELTNTKLNYASLVKYWAPEYLESGEAVSVKVNILKEGTVVSTVTLSKDNNWREVFDGTGQSGLIITKAEAKSDIYTFKEVPSLTNAYGEISAGWDNQTSPSVYTISNKPKRIKLTVKKKWDDNDDKDKIRPTTVGVRLVGSDNKVHFVGELNEANNWITTAWDLDKNLTYEWEEVYTIPAVALDDQKAGYVPIIRADSTDTYLTNITNVHGEDTQRTIKKEWNDQNDPDGIRPDSVKVTLLADGERAVDITGAEVPTAVLNEANNWTHTVVHLPIDNNDVPIEYIWKEEVVTEKNTVSQDMLDKGYSEDTILEFDDPNFPMTGDVKTGYASSTREDSSDPKITIMTNTHVPEKGKLTVHKKVRGDVLLNRNLFPVTFKFTLTGTTIYGDTVDPINQSVTLTKEKVEQLMEARDLSSDELYNDYIDISTQFENLTFGEYLVKESGMQAYFGIEDIVDVVSGEVNIDQDEVRSFVKPDSESAVTFVNGPYMGSFDITKYNDEKTDKLDGVEYVIESPYGEKMKAVTGKGIIGTYDEEGNYEEADTDENTPEEGKLRVEGLLPGTYTITEVKTLKGLSLLQEPFEITLPLVMTEEATKGSNVDTSKARYDADTKTYCFYDLSYTVTDTPVLDLPNTGVLEQYLPLWIGLGLAGGVIFLNRKNSNLF